VILYDDDLIRRVRESRAAQGLPPTVTDPGVLATVVSILTSSRNDEGAPASAPTSSPDDANPAVGGRHG